jgi:hypothetical protein
MARVRDRLKGAQVVTAPPSACTPTTDGGSSAVLTGDLNGDGRVDYAFSVATPDKRIHVVAALTRLDDFDLVDVSVPDQSAAPAAVVKRGAPYRETADGIELFFGTDTLTAGCGSGRTAYFWTGSVFDPRPVVIANAPSPS